MSMYIDHYPYKQFQITFFSIPIHIFRVDLNEAVKKKLNKDQKLTNTLALKIFEQIKLKSEVLSFLTKPTVFIPLSITVSAVGCFLPQRGIVSVVAGIVICALGGPMLGLSAREPFNHFLSQVSQAYSSQSRRASEYIEKLKCSDQEFLFLLG